jgi:hypothetical protein
VGNGSGDGDGDGVGVAVGEGDSVGEGVGEGAGEGADVSEAVRLANRPRGTFPGVEQPVNKETITNARTIMEETKRVVMLRLLPVCFKKNSSMLGNTNYLFFGLMNIPFILYKT